MDVSAPKSRASARQVAIPAFLRPVLISRVDGKQVDDLVFPAPGGATSETETGAIARVGVQL